VTVSAAKAAAVLAEVYHERHTPDPVAVGVSVFVIFLIALFVVTRLNRDR
jgi:hypothetical protein